MIKSRDIYSILLMVLIIGNCDSAKILVLSPTPCYSHQQPLLVLSRALALKGHNVTLVTTDPFKKPVPNLRQVDISFAYNYMHEHMREHMDFSLQDRHPPYTLITKINVWMAFLSEVFLGSEPVKALIREVNGTTFDLIIYESFGYTSLLGFCDLVGNPPVIGVSPMPALFPIDHELNNPKNPSYTPLVFSQYADKMTFSERFINTLGAAFFYYWTEYFVKPPHEVLIKKYFGNIKHTAEELDRNKSLVLFSSDLSNSYARPLQPTSVYVGAMHVVQDPEKRTPKLPDDLKKWMDEAEDGVIYFSMGSNMKGTSVDPEKRAAFIKAFSQFPKVRVIWKWESEERLPGLSDNVLLMKWLPQQALFAHPKLRLFISQVGLQSMQEAISNAVPVLGIPMFSDQDYNANRIEHGGGGLKIEFRTINYDVVYGSIKRILTEPSFKENMKKLQAIAKDKPMPPVETAVWWVEYVLRHQGAPHLRPASLDLTWYQYFLLDVIGAFLLALSIAVYIIYYIVRRIVKSFSVSNKVKES